MISALAFLKRDFRIETSYRMMMILRIGGIIFSVSLWFYISRLLELSGVSWKFGGSNYFSYVLVGMACLHFESAGLYAFANKLRTEQTTGTLEALMLTPLSPVRIMCYGVQWEFLQAFFYGVLYLVAGSVIFPVSFHWQTFFALVPVLLLGCLAFSSIGLLSAAFVLQFKRGDPVQFFWGAVASLIGGIYFPVSVMPFWLQQLSVLLPITHFVRAFRKVLLENGGLSALVPEMKAIALFAIVVAPVAVFCFAAAYRRALRTGSLLHY